MGFLRFSAVSLINHAVDSIKSNSFRLWLKMFQDDEKNKELKHCVMVGKLILYRVLIVKTAVIVSTSRGA